MIQTKTIAMLMIAIATVGVTTSSMSNAIPVRAVVFSSFSGHSESTSTSETISGHVSLPAGTGGGHFSETQPSQPKCVGSSGFEKALGC